jgi:hypothetical protein
MLGRTFGVQLQSSAAPSRAPASDTGKGIKPYKHLGVLYPTNIHSYCHNIFQGDLQKALGQVASGKWFLQESLPTQIFSMFPKTSFFSGNIFFLIFGEC